MKNRIIKGVVYYEVPASMIKKKFPLSEFRGCKFCDFHNEKQMGDISKGCNIRLCCPNNNESNQIFFKTKRSFFALMKGPNPYGK